MLDPTQIPIANSTVRLGVVIIVRFVFFHFSDSSYHQEDFWFHQSACHFVNFLQFSLISDSTILNSFQIRHFSNFIFIFRFYSSHCFQILPLSLFLDSSFLPIFLTDYHAKLQPRFSCQFHSCCAQMFRLVFLPVPIKNILRALRIRISVF